MLIAAFLIEKIAKYKKKHNSKIDLAYGKFSQKGNNVWNDSIYSYNSKYVWILLIAAFLIEKNAI